MKKLLLIVMVLLCPLLVAAAQGVSGPAKRIAFGANDPATCRPNGNNIFYNTTSDLLKICTATDTWTIVGPGAGGGSVTNTGTLTSGKAILGNGGTDVLASKVTITDPATSATLTLIDGTVITGPSATTTLPGLALTNSWSATNTFTGDVQLGTTASTNIITIGDGTSSSNIGRLRFGGAPAFAATYISILEPAASIPGTQQFGINIEVGNTNAKSVQGGRFVVTANSASGTTGQAIGFVANASNVAAGLLTKMVGFNANISNSGGLVDAGTGADLQITTAVGSTVTLMRGYGVILQNAGTIDEWRGIDLTGAGSSSTGTLTTSSAIYADTSLDAGTTRWFINSTSTSASRLGGDLTVSGLLKVGSGPTTLTDSTGKILSASLNTVAVANGGRGAGGAVTFANVPASPVEGMLVAVTDSTTAVWGATITGGGANHVLAYWNGSAWTVAAK